MLQVLSSIHGSGSSGSSKRRATVTPDIAAALRSCNWSQVTGWFSAPFRTLPPRSTRKRTGSAVGPTAEPDGQATRLVHTLCSGHRVYQVRLGVEALCAGDDRLVAGDGDDRLSSFLTTGEGNLDYLRTLRSINLP